MFPADHARWGYWLSAGVLIAAFLLQSFFASRIKSPVYDEPAHIAAGLSYLETGEFIANPQHPPLLKEMSALSLLLAGVRWPESAEARQLIDGGRDQLVWPVGNAIIAANGPDKVMFWSRLPFILLAALLGILLYVWGREMVGPTAALGALFLYALDPSVLAHSYLVTTDAGLAAFTVVFLWALWRYVRDPSLKRLLLCGLALGAVLGTKFSAILLLPVGAVLLLAAVRWLPEPVSGGPRIGPDSPGPGSSGPKHKKSHRASGRAKRAERAPEPAWWRSRQLSKFAVAAGAFLAMCLVAAVVIQALYFFSSDPFLYVAGLRRVNADHNPNYLAFMAGQLQHRFRSYFAVAYLLKEPAASILLAGLGLVVLVRSKTITVLRKLFLLLPPAALFAGYTIAADDVGIRYIIPALPFAFLAGGVGLEALIRNRSLGGRWLAAVLCVWMVVAAAGIYPDHLSYFNEAACLLQDPRQIGLDGGSRCGTLWLDESNVDWGQGLKQLKAWMDQHARGRTLHLAYHGYFPPEGYGVSHKEIGMPDLVGNPAPGLYVFSAHHVARIPALAKKLGSDAGQWLRRIPPTAIVGHSLYVYDIPQGSAAAPGHRFACTDYTQGKVFLVDDRGKVEWSYDAPHANDIWVLPNGNLLFNTGHGVKEVTRDKKVVFSYESTSEVYACQRLPNGNTFIGECNAGRLLEVNRAGQVVRQIRLLPEGKDGGSAYMRNARKLANGNYLVAHYEDQVVREYDPDGKVVWQVAAPGGPHSAVRLPDGNTLIASADRDGAPARVFEVAPDGRTIWEVRGEELPGISLKFMAGLHRLPNGNTVMSNWLGHGQFGKGPHLIEVTRDKRVVWTFADHQTMKTISSVEILDVPGDSIAGTVLH